MFIIAKHKDKRLCCAYRCKNAHAAKDRFCRKHRHRYTKEHDIVAYTFASVKSNAKRRGKEFGITLEWFREFCAKEGYIEGKGKTKKSLTLDRRDHTRGYVPDNIRILTLQDNSYKGAIEGHYGHFDDDDLPF